MPVDTDRRHAAAKLKGTYMAAVTTRHSQLKFPASFLIGHQFSPSYINYMFSPFRPNDKYQNHHSLISIVIPPLTPASSTSATIIVPRRSRSWWRMMGDTGRAIAKSMLGAGKRTLGTSLGIGVPIEGCSGLQSKVLSWVGRVSGNASCWRLKRRLL